MLLKVKFWLYIQNQGDGSAVVKFFKSEELANAAANEDEVKYGERYCDDVYSKTLTIDTETGEMA